jgi:hypothetical protein
MWPSTPSSSTSDDKLHKQLAPMVLAQDQRFVEKREFKADMARFAAHRRGTP